MWLAINWCPESTHFPEELLGSAELFRGADESEMSISKLIDAVVKWEDEVKRLRPTRGAEKHNSRLWDIQRIFRKHAASCLET
jgi:hypothetical protein